MVPGKKPLCWKWVWQPILSGYLWFQMAGIHLWNWIKELRRSVWYRAPEFLIIHAFWTGCQLFSYRELHIGYVQICNKEKKISDFPLYASLRFTHEDDSYHPISRRFSLKSPYHFYGKDIVKPKCHRNVRIIHPISLKTTWIVTKLGHFKIFSQYPCVTAAALWYPQWTAARFFWLAAGSPAPQSPNITWQ